MHTSVGPEHQDELMPFPLVDGLRALELGTPGPMRERLNALVVAGLKRATAGLVSDYVDEPFETPGEHLALVDNDLRRIATVQVTAVIESTFAQVPWSFAATEHEGDASIEEWRDGHRAFWEGEGVVVTDDMPVYLVYFELVEHD
jgi:uncharacterized protein YhfF